MQVVDESFKKRHAFLFLVEIINASNQFHSVGRNKAHHNYFKSNHKTD